MVRRRRLRPGTAREMQLTEEISSDKDVGFCHVNVLKEVASLAKDQCAPASESPVVVHSRVLDS